MDGFSLPVFPKESTDRTPTDVIVKLRETLKQNPADLKTRIRLAAALDSAGEASEAEDVLRAALQRKQKTPEVFRALGMVYLRNQVYTGAIDAYLAATKLEPNNFDSRFKLGAAFAYLGMTEEARREFEIARKLNPDNPEVYIGLAFINNGQDRYPYAVKYLLEYIKRAPEPGNGYGLLSRVYLNMRVFDKAMRAGESAVKLMPDNPYVWYNLGQAYLYQPNNKYLPQAVDALLKAVNYSPNWASANFELGRAYARLGKTTDAIASYRSAVDAEPTSGRYKYQLGQLLVKSGQTEEGNRMVADASRLIRLNQRETRLLNQLTAKPNDTTRLYELSQIYKQLGDFGRAASVLRTLLSVNPNDDRARAEHRHLQALAAKRS
jgi:cytochrome c-type biogenesis protein CcmH/NrfG